MISLTGTTSGFSGDQVASTGNLRTRTLSLIAFCFLSLIIVSGAIGLPARAAHAQQLSASDFSANWPTTENGWWSPQRIQSRRMSLHLQISTGDQIPLSNVKLLPATLQTANYGWISLVGDAIGNRSALGTRLQTKRQIEAELVFPESFLSALQLKYLAWESRLEDSETRTNVNGLLVYPLLVANYGGWNLPISMYIPPLRGSDSRR